MAWWHTRPSRSINDRPLRVQALLGHEALRVVSCEILLPPRSGEDQRIVIAARVASHSGDEIDSTAAKVALH